MSVWGGLSCRGIRAWFTSTTVPEISLQLFAFLHDSFCSQRDQSLGGFPTGILLHAYLKWDVKVGSYLDTIVKEKKEQGGRRKLAVSWRLQEQGQEVCITVHTAPFLRVSLLCWQVGERGPGLAPGGFPTVSKLLVLSLLISIKKTRF